jgi:hypothetical protein
MSRHGTAGEVSLPLRTAPAANGLGPGSFGALQQDRRGFGVARRRFLTADLCASVFTLPTVTWTIHSSRFVRNVVGA